VWAEQTGLPFAMGQHTRFRQAADLATIGSALIDVATDTCLFVSDNTPKSMA